MSVFNRDVRVQRRRLRKDHRARAGKRIRRRNLAKFIPSSDSDFAMTGRNFVNYLRIHADACHVTSDTIADLDRAVTHFRGCLAVTQVSQDRNTMAVIRKNEARLVAAEAVSAVADVIRADRNIDLLHKRMLRIKVKPKRMKQRNCPVRPPMLQFVGTDDGQGLSAGMGGGSGVHIIKFFDTDGFGVMKRAKPDGAARLELFIDYVPEGAPIPTHPAQQRGWHNYVGSFTKSPMRVEFPVPRNGAMLIVYWARWADATGAVGKFSKTCVARMEGWSSSPVARAELETQAQHSLVDTLGSQELEAKFVVIQAPLQLPEAHGASIE